MQQQPSDTAPKAQPVSSRKQGFLITSLDPHQPSETPTIHTTVPRHKATSKQIHIASKSLEAGHPQGHSPTTVRGQASQARLTRPPHEAGSSHFSLATASNQTIKDGNDCSLRPDAAQVH